VIGEDRDGETEQIGGVDIEAEVSGALVTGLEEIRGTTKETGGRQLKRRVWRISGKKKIWTQARTERRGRRALS